MPKWSSRAIEYGEALLEKSNFGTPTDAPLYCGVSGGADSVALLWLAKQAGLSPVAAHVDHGIREQTEAGLVEDIAQKFECKFVSYKAKVSDGSDLEQRARVARHELLGPNALLGHTMDDQAETVLINLLRGAGPAGLAGIAPDHKHPILGLRRSETHQLCKLLDINVFEDPSNSDPRFLRNRIRNELLPLADQISERDLAPLLNRTAQRNSEIVSYLDEAIQSIDPTDTRVLSTHHLLIRKHALREWLRDELGHPPSAAELGRVVSVVQHEVLACEISGGRRIARTDGVLRVEKTGSV